MHAIIKAIEDKQRKPHVVDVRSGDMVKIHQKITEDGKSRTQVFEGLVIRTSRKNSLTSSITVRRIASGVGVEKSFLIHSPTIEKIEVVKRSKVRRNNLSYMRERSGKSARLAAVNFDRDNVNYIPDPEVKEEPAPEVEESKEQAPEDESGSSNATDETKAENDQKQPQASEDKS